MQSQIWQLIASLPTPGFFITAEMNRMGETMPEGLEDFKSTKKTAEASEVERLAHAFRLGLRRAFQCGSITFADDTTCKMSVCNQTEFDTIWFELGFKNISLVLSMIEKFGSTSTFLLATGI